MYMRFSLTILKIISKTHAEKFQIASDLFQYNETRIVQFDIKNYITIDLITQLLNNIILKDKQANTWHNFQFTHVETCIFM